MSALTVFPSQISASAAYRDATVLGILMDTGQEKAVVTLTSFVNGDASLYFSAGGGVIGGIGHADVRIAARRFTQFAGALVSEMSKCTDFPLPVVGQTTFYVITTGGVFTLTAPEQQLSAGLHDFSPLYHAGHYVISRLLNMIQKRNENSVA